VFFGYDLILRSNLFKNFEEIRMGEDEDEKYFEDKEEVENVSKISKETKEKIRKILMEKWID